MQILDGGVVLSASDLTAAASCEFALLRSLDAQLGRLDPAEAVVDDAMLARTASLGLAHEERLLAELLSEHGPFNPATGRGVLTLPSGAAWTRGTLTERRDRTLEALRAGADVVYQGQVFDGTFSGRADFLVHTDAGYVVLDTKLARHAKVTAVLQLAAYGDVLAQAGIPLAPAAELVLGDRSRSVHRLDDVIPVFRHRRARLEHVLARHLAATGPAAWGATDVQACGRCATCESFVAEHRDLLLVAGLTGTQRTRLRAAGLATIDDLAASEGPIPGMASSTAATLRAQASLQVQQSPPDGHGPVLPDGRPEVTIDVFAPDALSHLPRPDAGDLFFDFEGDPLWSEDTSTDWGLEYLFGVLSAVDGGAGQSTFTPLWAHDRAQERQALLDFLALVVERRERNPGMHVYHYAPYETTALKRLVGRHGVGEEVLDDLLRCGVFVDLYAVVRAGIRTSQPSYSIKALEPLYSPTARAGVTNAQDSITEYADACALREAGLADAYAEKIGQIAAYNRDDCVSTRDLRDWLLDRAREHGVKPAGRTAELVGDATVRVPGDLELRALAAEQALRSRMRDVPQIERTAEEQALAMLAAALHFHRREERPAWWEHFDRLGTPVDEWTSRSVFRPGDRSASGEDPVAATPWRAPAAGSSLRSRELTLRGLLEPGSDLGPGASMWAVYETAAAFAMKSSASGSLCWNPSSVTIETVRTVGEETTLRVTEKAPRGETGWDAVPVALVPVVPMMSKPLQIAVCELAEEVVASHGRDAEHASLLPARAVLDLLRRTPPRFRPGHALPPADDREADPVDALTRAVLGLDGSYIAVQGPPGTGKTYTGSHVIARLVSDGWRVGVVAQSHAVVENMLAAVRAAGVGKDQVAKKPSAGAAAHDWTALDKPTDFAAFLRSKPEGTGYVVGGTAWDFAPASKVPEGGYDLLVIDEAGQFALANTLAVARSARNVLLLGDPQQLPQVSQGTHPEPVETSALAWLMAGHATLPDGLGFFLARSWRMHPAVCSAVSRLSYENRVVSQPGVADRRGIEGVDPGVRTVLVAHDGDATVSTAEADTVVEQVRTLVGRRWTDPHARTPGDRDRPLTAADVLVVAAYNAQVSEIRRRLVHAGLGETRVGTVDKFQGQEAPVAIMSLAASSAAEVPRGIEFLLNRNRVNVAVSRAQVLAVVVRAPGVVDHLPATPAGLAELGAFLGLSPTIGPAVVRE